jgi:uncharacterized membrane protein YdjX (TVP38/TMEM64 family)
VAGHSAAENDRMKGDPQRRIWLLIPLALGLSALYLFARPWLDLGSLAQQEQALRTYQQRHPWLVYLAAAAIYVSVTGFSLPGAAGLTLLYGWYFGFLPAVVLVSLSATAGATLAFLMSRYLFRDLVISRYRERLRTIDEHLRRDGAWYLFTLRLIPAVPFFLVNLLMGLTQLPTFTFWWVSQLGMLPGTAAYVYAGASVPSLEALAADGIRAAFSAQQLGQLVLAFGILGLMPWLLRLWFGPTRGVTPRDV